MKLHRLKLGRGFRVYSGNRRSHPKNRHRGADQWLFVLEGRGSALVKNRRYPLDKG